MAVASSGPSNRSMSTLCLRAPELDVGLLGGSQQSGAEGQNPLPCSAGHAAGDAVQGTVVLLGCQHTLPGCVELLISWHPQVLSIRAALNPFILGPVLILGVALTQVQDLALGLVVMNFTQAHLSAL